MSTISNSWSRMTSLSSLSVDTVTPSTTASAKAADALDADEFRSWTLAAQVAYVKAKGAASGTPLTIGPSTGEQIKATWSSSLMAPSVVYNAVGGGSATPASPTLPSVEPDSRFSSSPANLDPSVFLSWSPANQLKYLANNSVSALGGTLTIGASAGHGTAVATLVNDLKIEGSPIVQAGTSADIPYYNLPGSSVGQRSAFVMDKAEALFPTLNGTTSKLDVADRPANFYVSPTSLDGTTADQNTKRKNFLADFVTWHSAYQLEYIKTYGSAGVLTIPTVSTQVPELSAIVSGNKVIILNSLQKADIAKLSLSEQATVASQPFFTGRTTSPIFTGMKGRLSLDPIATGAIDNFNKLSGNLGTSVTLPNACTDLVNYINNRSYSYRQMPADDRAYFIKEINIIKEQLTGMAIVSTADVKSRLSAIKDRYDRAFAFYDVRVPQEVGVPMKSPNVYVSTYSDVIGQELVSNDSFETPSTNIEDLAVTKGYHIFIAQEKKIADLAEARMAIVRDNGALFGKTLDVPELVYRFQSLYNSQLEAEVVMETEEINQQNILLKTYAAMQDAINLTLSKFTKADEGTQYLYGKGHVDDYQYFTPAERLLSGMFEDWLGAGMKHPLETLRNIKRPLENFFKQPGSSAQNENNTAGDYYDLEAKSHTQWSTYGTRLSETVTIINQNSQIKMNDVNSLDKQRNRHFELANSALSKMNEILSNIARA